MHVINHQQFETVIPLCSDVKQYMTALFIIQNFNVYTYDQQARV